jgi:hypothetical protein
MKSVIFLISAMFFLSYCTDDDEQYIVVTCNFNKNKHLKFKIMI